MTTPSLLKIIRNFLPDKPISDVTPFGSGHINDSYLVKASVESGHDYVLQRINHNIFKNIPQLTENIRKVTNHISNKLQDDPLAYPGFMVFRQVQCNTGNYFFQDEAGNFWRLIDCIPGSRSFDVVESPGFAFEAGKAFAIFQVLTADLNAGGLYEILPDFHDIRFRLENFRRTVLNDPADRVKDHQVEIDFIEQRANEMHHILQLGQAGLIPLRVTHNDTKINNVLFNDQNKAISVVDLDTVMPGYVLYDFGDAIRTGACTSAEDEPDLAKVGFSLPLFQSYSTGYLGIAKTFLTSAELKNLAFSAKYMTYLIGLRFFTDHLDGDQYYKIRFPGHNLQRAKVQFKLLGCMEACFEEMENMINKT